MAKFLLQLQLTLKIIIILIFLMSHVIYLSYADVKMNNDLSWWNKMEAMLVHLSKIFINFNDFEMQKQKPCDNFYGFVCGRNFSRLTTISTFQKDNSSDIHHIEWENFHKFIQNDSKNDDQLMDSELKLKDFYTSCRKARSLEDLKASNLYKTSGSWPAIEVNVTEKQLWQDLNKNNNSNVTWMDILTAFHSVGSENFFTYRIKIKSNRRIIELIPNINQHYTLLKYEQLVEEILIEYKVGVDRAHLIGLEIANFERNRRKSIRGSNITNNLIDNMNIDENMEISYHEFKYKIFPQYYNIEWDIYFRKILGKQPKEMDVVRVYKIQQFRNIFDLLAATPINCLLNYLWIEYLIGKSIEDCQVLSKEYFKNVYRNIMERSLTNKLQTAQMFSEIGKSYEKLQLPLTSWIDEMTYENSKQFLGRIIHLTLNSDMKLDTEYSKLKISKENFYQNLENCQRFISKQKLQKNNKIAMDDFNNFFKNYLNVLSLLNISNLIEPLNYPIIGEYFAEQMIAGGKINTPGSWRSTDSDQEFIALQQCLQQQKNSVSYYDANNLLLRILAQKQTFLTFNEWQNNNREFVEFIESKIPFSLNKIYFILSIIRNCEGESTKQNDFIKIYLQNSKDFIQTFQCQQGDQLFIEKMCSVL